MGEVIIMKYLKKAEAYFSRHVFYGQLIHLIGGMGLGILITYPLVGEHPVRWGLALLAVALIGHLAPWLNKK